MSQEIIATCYECNYEGPLETMSKCKDCGLDPLCATCLHDHICPK